jgi:2,4-dienoyl-CoA reductase-like NADH-dependent reductase (Old Yellow Enzyme family)
VINRKHLNLFNLIKIGPLTFENRIVSAPTSATDLSSECHLTRDNIAYFKLKAKAAQLLSPLARALFIPMQADHTLNRCSLLMKESYHLYDLVKFLNSTTINLKGGLNIEQR